MASHVPLYGPARAWLPLFVSIVLGATLACQREQRGEGLEQLRVEQPRSYFRQSGFVEMVPPLRLPLRSRRHRVNVWLKIPAGELIRTRTEAGRPLLQLPAGSEAARVERIGGIGTTDEATFKLADVRGTRFSAKGETFYALRPAGGGMDAPLLGYAWPRGDSIKHARATELLAQLVSQFASARDRKSAVRTLRATMGCAACHEHGRAENMRPGEHGLANRGTDASGCYQIQNVLLSRVPVESYFPVETNLDDRFISFDCGWMPALLDRRRGIRCADGSIPRGSLDVRAALRAGDEHARRVCASRRFLFDRLDAAGRRMFREGFAECGFLGADPKKTSDL